MAPVCNALKIANEQGFQSISFPLIGAGSGAFHRDGAKEIMPDELRSIDAAIQRTLVLFRNDGWSRGSHLWASTHA